VSFRYFAYGSNMWTPRLTDRCPSARPVGTAVLHGWCTAYDKSSRDGSAKLNLRPDPTSSVTGVVYELDERDRPRLDAAEPFYEGVETPVGWTYVYRGEPTRSRPHDWYVALVDAGARAHGLEPPPLR
jgi:cation transport regulator ChaC